MSDSGPFRARFRFRVAAALNRGERHFYRQIRGYRVRFAGADRSKPVWENQWLIATSPRFEHERDAREFGESLRRAVALSSIACRLGVDTGLGAPTGWTSQRVKDAFQSELGVTLRDDVHGVDVFRDAPRTRFALVSANGVVRKNAEPFFSQLDTLWSSSRSLSQEAVDVILLLNYALMRVEPAAQILFAVSAVEMIGQRETWSAAQRRLLDQLSNAARMDTTCGQVERSEVADAIARGAQKLSLRQGVLRLIDRLGMASDRKIWDQLYEERSKLVHGLAPAPGADYSDLARRTMSLCGRILIRFLAKEVEGIDVFSAPYYP